MWECKHWSTTHGTCTHKGPPLSKTKKATHKDNAKSEDNQGNLADLVKESTNPCDLEIGAWCGYTTEPINTITSEDSNLGTWIPSISRIFKTKKNTLIFGLCQSLYLISPETNYTTCHWCNPNTVVIQMLMTFQISSITEVITQIQPLEKASGFWLPAKQCDLPARVIARLQLSLWPPPQPSNKHTVLPGIGR